MRPQILFPLFADTRSLPGVGPKVAESVERLAGGRVVDLIYHLPSGVVDRRYRPAIDEAETGRVATFTVRVLEHQAGSGRRSPYRVVCGDGRDTLTLVFFHARAVRDQWRVADEWHLAPYRRARVAEMKQAESRLRVALRESNTLTARAYTRSPEDSFFLFFTDSPDAVALRPLLGVFNVGAGVVQTLWGTLAAPFDRGRRLVSGVRGVVMSMPELAFFNVRKGSYAYVPREQGRRVELAVAR